MINTKNSFIQSMYVHNFYTSLGEKDDLQEHDASALGFY